MSARGLTALLLGALLAAGCTSQAGNRGSGAPHVGTMPATSAVATLPVPALSVDHPQVVVTPDHGLRDGQWVDVEVTGFGVGGKVWVSECASASVASSLGCGLPLVAQPFLVTDEARAGQMSLKLRIHAPAQAISPVPTATCTDGCVIVATLGEGFAYAVAPITFAPTAAVPSVAVAACVPGQLATSVVDTGAAAGMVSGWLRFVNVSSLPCQLDGWPTLVGVTASGSRTTARHALAPLGLPPDAPVTAVALGLGDAAVAFFAGSDNPAGSAATCPPSYATLLVAAPGTPGSVSLSAFNHGLNADLPACSGIAVSWVVPASSVPGLKPYRP